MRYDHMVKVNGKYYQAGEDVPENKMAEEETQLPFSDSDVKFESKEDKIYTKSDINRMKTAELQELARNRGIADANNMTGQELKENLLNLFGL